MLFCYWFLIAFAALVWVITWAVGTSKIQRDQAVIVSFFSVYIACVCFRAASIGVDTNNYEQMYEIGSTLGWNYAFLHSGKEIGFQIICKIVNVFGGKELLFIITGLISIIPVAMLYYRESEDGPLCCTFFLISLLFEFFFSGIRQGLAIGFGIIAFFFVQKKNPILFLVMVAVATSMHSSAFVLLLLYPLYYAKITQKWVPFILIGMVAVYLTRDTIFNSMLLPLFGGDYLDGYGYLTGESGQGTLSILFLLLAIYSCVILDPVQADSKTLGFRNILILSAIIHLFTPLHPVVCRLNYYFILYIPIAISRVNARAKRIALPIVQISKLVLPAFFVMYFLFMKDDSLQIAPYVPFFL